MPSFEQSVHALQTSLGPGLLEKIKLWLSKSACVRVRASLKIQQVRPFSLRLSSVAATTENA